MDWATKRQVMILSTIFFVFLVIGVAVYFLNYYEAPTCSDKVQNQDEQGIDCGGPCSVMCEESVAEPIVLWKKAFKVAPGVYNAVAYVENPNPDLGVREAMYKFKLYDAQNVWVADRIGKAYIAPHERLAIFEPRIGVGARTPTKVFFEFIQFSPWTKVSVPKIKMTVRDEEITNTDIAPKADAVLRNETLLNINNIDVTAIVYDLNENAIGASATVVDTLQKSSDYTLSFTWAVPFATAPARVEIIPRVNPFDLSITAR